MVDAELEERFKKASENVTKISKAPDQLEKLKLYAMYKQASSGDCTGDRPGIMNPVGRAKYDAWKALEGKSQEEAMREYAEFAESLIERDKQANQ